MMGWLSRDSSTYKVLDNIGSAPLYFLPILVAITTAMKLKVNVLVAVSAVSVMVLPAMTKQLAEGTAFMSFDLRNVAYASQVFPAILCVFYAQTEKLFNRYSPGALRIFLSPMLSLLVTVPVTLLIPGRWVMSWVPGWQRSFCGCTENWVLWQPGCLPPPCLLWSPPGCTSRCCRTLSPL
jgi:PTS system beta-glucosides-specific IIC component